MLKNRLRTILFSLSLAAMVIGPLSNAIAQKSLFPDRTRITGGKMKLLGKGQFQGRVIRAMKMKRVPFRKLTLKRLNDKRKKSGSRGSKKALKGTDTIKIPRAGSRGKSTEMTVDDYLKEFNKFQEMAAAKGYDLENETEKRDESIEEDKAAVERQRTALSRDLKPVRPMKTSRKFAYQNLPRKAGSRGRKGGSWRLLKGVNSFKYSKGSRGKKESLWDKTKKHIKYKKTLEKEFSYGDKKTAAIGVKAKLDLFASLDKVELKALGGAYVWLFKKEIAILEAKARFTGLRKGWKTSGEVTLKVIGLAKIDVLKWPKKGGRGKALWSKTGEKPFGSKKFGYTYRFVIGVIPVSVEVGASFEAGLRWRVELTKMKVSAEVGPYLDSDGYASFAVDALILKAGVRADVTLLDIEFMIGGEVGVTNDKEDDIYVYAQFVGDLGIKALDGKLSLFIDIYNIFKLKYSRLATLTLFSWKGLEKRWRLFELKTPRWYIKGKASQVGSLAEGPTPMKGKTKNASGSKISGYTGSWANKVNSCSNSYANGFRVRVQPRQGKKDDTGLNGIQFSCADLKGANRGTAKSSETSAPGSKWSSWVKCKKGHFLVSYQLRMEKNAGKRGDDVAATNVRFKCSDGKQLTPKVKWSSGSWKSGQTCGSDGFIDGLKTRVATWSTKGKWIGTAPFCKGRKSDCTKRGMLYNKSSKRGNGKKCWSGRKVHCLPDNTALNGLEIGCSWRPGFPKKKTGGKKPVIRNPFKGTTSKTFKNKRLKVLHSGLCLDVPRTSRKNGVRIQQYRCHNGANQRWHMDSKGRIRSAATGKCLDIAGASRKQGAAVQQYACHNGKNQQWFRTSAGEIKSKLHGMCLDVKSWSKKNGGKLHMWKCHGGKNQKFSH